MRFIRSSISGVAGRPLAGAASTGKRSLIGGHGQFAALFLALALTGCSSNPLAGLNPFKSDGIKLQQGAVGYVEGFLGGVVADEPRAALIGREILSAGGTAADAAAAVALTLSVTLPSSASLGGGGVCVVRHSGTGKTETLNFQAVSPKKIPSTTVHPTAVPGFIRGIAALHAKYGRLTWAQVIAPAEKLARFGNQVSLAFAEDLRKAAPATLADPGMRKIVAPGKGGTVAKEGDFITQTDLSSVLGRLRARGGGDFYAGLTARQFVAAVNRVGGSLSIEDMRAYKPDWRPTIKIPYIEDTHFHFPTPPGPAGVLAAQMMGMLVKQGDWKSLSPEARAHLLAEVTGRAYAGRDAWLGVDGTIPVKADRLITKEIFDGLLAGYRPDRHASVSPANRTAGENPDNPAGTGFVAADREGSAVACVLTLNNLFGVGRVAQGMGIILAALPGPRGRGPDTLVPVLLVSELHNVFYFAAAASGGVAAPSALVNVTARALLGRKEEDLEAAIAAKRIHHDVASGVTYYEQGTSAAVVNSLTSKGHRVGPTAAIGLVNVLFCPIGVPATERGASCAMKPDPRGHGLAAGSD